jgi:hypothetical protein
MKDLKMPFPSGDDGVQKRTLEGGYPDYKFVWYEPNWMTVPVKDFDDVAKQYPMKPDQVFKKSYEDDVVMATAMMGKYHQGADLNWGDDHDARVNEKARQERQKRYDETGVY